MHFVTMAHQLAWMEHPATWLCVSCAILWLVLRSVRSPLVRAGVLLMLCGLGMNALATDTNAGSMPVIGVPSTVRPAVFFGCRPCAILPNPHKAAAFIIIAVERYKVFIRIRTG